MSPASKALPPAVEEMIHNAAAGGEGYEEDELIAALGGLEAYTRLTRAIVGGAAADTGTPLAVVEAYGPFVCAVVCIATTAGFALRKSEVVQENLAKKEDSDARLV